VIYQALMFFGQIVALALGALLWALAGLHAYWGRGGLWPEADEASLARTVIGAAGVREMPSASACYGAASVLFFAGLWPLTMIAGLMPALLPAELMLLAGYGLAAIFLGRGAAAYLPVFRRVFSEEPFATLDRRLYGPLCLAIGFGFSFLLSLGWIRP
jgi:hypothetical protein